MKISHYVDKNMWDIEIGLWVTGVCGTLFQIKDLGEKRPICFECAELTRNDAASLQEIVEDLDARMLKISKAIAMKDSLGQHNLIHTEAEELLCEAFFAPGPARPEGPDKEDGSFW